MFDFKAIEKEIFNFWENKKIYSKIKKRNKGKKPFYYLDGPPYTSGKVHLGTAWGKALRDCFMRYKRMRGFDVWDRSGFDMHGLPTEQAVEKKLGISDVEKFGVLKYIKECEKLCISNMNAMIEDFKKLGVWMDFDNPYMSIKNSYIEGVWWLVKKAHDKKRLYEGLRTMPWCPSCGSANAKHEIDYKNVKEKSIFFKFPLVGVKNEYLVLWTTTPWTIPFNLAVMVNPELEYVKCKLDNGEVWIVAKALSGALINGVADRKFEILDSFKGEELEGLKYKHPFRKYIPFFDKLEKENDKLHTVILSKEYVNVSSGSGLVHCAPGCGPADYEVGHAYKLPPFNTINKKGIFDESIPKFEGFVAKKDDGKIIDLLEDEGALIATTEIEHEYPYCWRCNGPVVFRTTKQWFFKIEDLKENMRELNKKIYWVPDWAGSKQFDAWLENLRDNSITKQRYWGTPAPIWKCKKCGDYEVIGSLKDLRKVAEKVPENLHKPWIDEVKIKCGCGGTKKRIPDVLDVWIDAGCASWLCLDYPRRKDLFNKLYPADFILEGKDQIRGWFNLLFIASMIALEGISYKAVYMHGFINDSLGRKMSKSLGNYILPQEVIEKYGADCLRYYCIGGANAGIDMNYNFNDIKNKFKNLGILWNLHKFLLDFGRQNKLRYKKVKTLDMEEKYIYSKLNSCIEEVTYLFDNYYLDEIPDKIENLFLDLSRVYIRLVREKSVSGTKEEKQKIFSCIYDVLLNSLILFSPVVPFLTEKIYLNLKEEFMLKEESIHFYKWPKSNKNLIDKKLEGKFELFQRIVQEALSQREKIGFGVRWPLKEITIKIENKNSLSGLKELIKNQVNVKNINLEKGNFEIKLNPEMDKKLEEEGFARELARNIQVLRKKAGLKREDLVDVNISSEVNLSNWKKWIIEKVGARKLIFEKTDKNSEYRLDKEIKGKKFVIDLFLL